MFHLSKKQWVKQHGEIKHNKTWKLLGWSWTPKVCRCSIPYYLNTEDK